MKSILLGLGNVGLNYDYNLRNVIYTHAKALFKNKKLDFLYAIDKSKQQRNKFKNRYNIKIKTGIDDINLDVRGKFFSACRYGKPSKTSSNKTSSNKTSSKKYKLKGKSWSQKMLDKIRGN